MEQGTIYRISGPVVTAKNLSARMYDLVQVGNEKLMGEVIQIYDDKVVIQVYEDTSGIKPGEPVINTGKPLSVELGPGLIESIYDGIQRPLPVLEKEMGSFIKRGVSADALNTKRLWPFKPSVKKGDIVKEGMIIGEVPETETISHKIMVPVGMQGRVEEIKSGEFKVRDVICKLENNQEMSLSQTWPVRVPRPVTKKLAPDIPLITGQRVFDAFFPLAKGGVAAIPGPFGSGKCVTGDTKILADGRLVTIRSVFDSAKGNLTENRDEKLIELKNPFSVYTFNGEKIIESKATHVYKGKTKQLIKIKTRSGKTAKITPIHKLFKLNENLEIAETEAYKLGEGDYIISPRKLEMNAEYQKIRVDFGCRVSDEEVKDSIPLLIDEYTKNKRITKKELANLIGEKYHNLITFYIKRNSPTLEFVRKIYSLVGKEPTISHIKIERQSKTIKVPEYLNEEFSEFLGYLMADGMIRGGQTAVFFNKNENLRKRLSYLAKELFCLETNEFWARTVEAVSGHSRTLVKMLCSLGYPLKQKSNRLKIPEILINSPESVIKSFLVAYISCDGHVSKKDVEITTASKDMAEGLAYLLLRIGVLHKYAEKNVKGKVYYRIFIAPKEAIKIHPYFNKKFYYSSTDIVPMNSLLFRRILGDVKPWELEKKGISTVAYYVKQNQTANTFQKIANALNVESLKTFANALNYVFCDEIVEIETLNEETEIYDITVPKTHNFVGGNLPMILHNTVSQHQLAKWSDADIIVYVGCGERGNEMTDVLTEFPHLKDPKTGKSLMSRTVLIANTSNMPVAAREASVYTGITIAEYYRDMGYSVALMADSTSRWAEAMREISSRLEEMPGEEGYPAYLGSRVAEFYERAGRTIALNGNEGSVTIIGAVSPPGGDFSEPVTQNTLRVVKTFWALDARLAQRRHFPSINWLTSYSLYKDSLEPWYKKNVSDEWSRLVNEMMFILQEEENLLEIVQLVGSDALPEKQQLVLEVARMIREFVLQQSAFHDVDTFCEPVKTNMLMKTILEWYNSAKAALDAGISIQKIVDMKSKDKIVNAKFEKDYKNFFREVDAEIKKEFSDLRK